MNDEFYMRLAIDNAVAAIDAGQMPIGSIVVRDGQVLLAAHNTVWRDCDPSAHAEMNAIRQTARQLGSIDLSGCTIYCTLEPCPMCLTASHWARIERIVYGASIADSVVAGFSEMTIPAKEMLRLGASPLSITAGVLSLECIALFARWKQSGRARTY